MIKQTNGQSHEHGQAGEVDSVVTNGSGQGERKVDGTGHQNSDEADVAAEEAKTTAMLQLDSHSFLCPPCPTLNTSLCVSTCSASEAIFAHDSMVQSCMLPLTFSAPIMTDSMLLPSAMLLPGIVPRHSEMSKGPPAQILAEDSAKNCVTNKSQCYECLWKQCGQTFGNIDDLVVHVNDHHVKVERPDIDYQCKWTGCPRLGKGFNARYKMLIHVRTHTNEKPHRCNICGKCFSRLENLKIHKRSHTGEKPYVCPFEGCHKAYSNSSDRFKHVRTHQEEKPYLCKMPGCSKRYTDPSSLRKHVRTHGHFYRHDNDCFTSRVRKTAPSHTPASTLSSSSLSSSSSSLASVINIGPQGLVLNPQNSHFVPLQNNIFQLPTPLPMSGQSHALMSAQILSGNVSMVTSHFSDILPKTLPPLPLSVLKVEPPSCCDEMDKSQDTPLDLSRSPITHPDSPDSDASLGLQNTSVVCRSDLELKISQRDLKNGLLDLSCHSVADPAKSSVVPGACWSSVLFSTPPSSKSVRLDLPCCLLPQ